MNNEKERSFILTTIDNPFDPRKDFDSWFDYDEQNNYCSCELIDRIQNLFKDTETDEEKLYQKAIDFIIRYDFTEKYIKLPITTT